MGVVPVRLIATDLDGTIVRSDGTISDRTAKALAAAEDCGVTVVLVTGRPPRWIAPVAEATGHHGIVICSNGGLVYDLHTEQVMESFLIPARTVAEVVDILHGAMPELAFAVETGADVYRSHGYRGGWITSPEDDTVSFPLNEVTKYEAAKLLASHPTIGADELLERARDLVGHLVEATHSNGRGLIEMGALGVSKATTLARYAGELGITAEDVVAFGDMPNDLPMLAWAGISYAVANAHPLVLQAVDNKTASNDDDGVAEVIEQLLQA